MTAQPKSRSQSKAGSESSSSGSRFKTHAESESTIATDHDDASGSKVMGESQCRCAERAAKPNPEY